MTFSHHHFSKISSFRLVFLPFVICLLCACLSCSKSKNSASSDDAADVDVDVSGSLSIFPHADGWESASSHGSYVITNGYQNCSSCHSTSQTEIIQCQTCHASYPHDDANWPAQDGHGAYVLASSLNECQSCHGEDLTGGNTGTSCFKCHTNYPHTGDNWTDSSEHGLYVYANGTGTCKDCHGSDLLGGTSGTSCYSCHTNYPHAADWVSPSVHGAYVDAYTYRGCQGCHGTDYQGGISGTSCYDCHESYPHTASDWTSATGHGSYAVANGITSCQPCHGSDYLGGTTGKSCYTCHSIYPHTWATSTEHGSAYAANPSTCTSCHGEDLTGGLSGVSCSNCHVGYPHAENWADPSADPSWHGASAEGDLKTACQTCHGSTYLGGTSSISCYSCHAIYPHTWADDTAHGAAYQADTTACTTACHGTDLAGGLSGTACTSCHADYPHSTSWASGAGHGANFSSRYTSYDSPDATCWACHGEPVMFDTTQTQATLEASSDCYGCHWAYPHDSILSSSTSDTTRLTWEVFDSSERTDPEYYEFSWVNHVWYLMNIPLFVDTTGHRPTSAELYTTASDGAVTNTCGGGTAGLCHATGSSHNPTSTSTVRVCSVLCHD